MREYLQKRVPNLLKSRAAVSVREKLFSVISFDDSSSPSVSFLDYRYWPVKDLELARWQRCCLYLHGKNRLAIYCIYMIWCSLGMFKLACATFTDVDCRTSLGSSIVFWMVKGEWKDICLRKGTSEYFAVNPTACLVQNRRHQLFPKPSKNFASKWLRSAAGKSKTSTMIPLFIEDKYR